MDREGVEGIPRKGTKDARRGTRDDRGGGIDTGRRSRGEMTQRRRGRAMLQLGAWYSEVDGGNAGTRDVYRNLGRERGNHDNTGFEMGHHDNKIHTLAVTDDEAGKTSGRKDRLRGQIGVSTIALSDG